MRRLVLSLLFLSCSALAADDLAQAERLLVAGDFGKAMPTLTRLAQAGNPNAQLRLGEMYWFGEGAAQDLDAARNWFEKAAASGSTAAREALAALDRRKARGAEIAYWTQHYDGADLRAGKFSCPVPAIPAVSTSSEDISETLAEIRDWQACHTGFLANMGAVAKGVRQIPADVRDMMTPDEVKRAQAHLKGVYGKLIAQSSADVEAVKASEDVWNKATGEFVKGENLRMAMLHDEQHRLIDRVRRAQDERRDAKYRKKYLPATSSTRN